MAKVKYEVAFDPRVVAPNEAGNVKVNTLALKKVEDVFTRFENMRIYTKGGESYDLIYRLDKLFRMYSLIRRSSDHSYKGNAKIFMPIARKAVNTTESSVTGALLGRDEYFSVEIEDINDAIRKEMSDKAFQVLMSYSNDEKIPSQLRLAIKQCLIYGYTVVETVFSKEEFTQMFRKIEDKPVLAKDGSPAFVQMIGDPNTMVPVPPTRTTKFIEQRIVMEKPRIEARDIYKMYFNLFINDPEQDDIIYLDGMSAQDLLIAAEQGIYNKEAVKKLIQGQGTYNSSSRDGSDRSETYIGNNSDDKGVTRLFSIKRFQGLFSSEDQSGGDTIHYQYFIDIGEDREVLQVRKNRLISQSKTFSFATWDIMLNEFCSDGVIDPIMAINLEINDKENQSLDAVTFQNLSPWLKDRKSNIKPSDVALATRKAHHMIETNSMDGLKKMQVASDVTHVNLEIERLTTTANKMAGSMNTASGSPSGTSADRSGKALQTLISRGDAQNSSFIIQFEKTLMQPALQKMWDMIVLFSNDEKVIDVMVNDKKTGEKKKINVIEIGGRGIIKVSGGSHALKERQIRDEILEFVSILQSNDKFMEMADVVPILQDLARFSNQDMSKYVNPENLYNKLMGMINQLQGVLGQQGSTMETMNTEISRLRGELSQTARTNMQNPAPEDLKKEILAGMPAQGGQPVG